MGRHIREVGVGLLLAFVVFGLFLLGQLMYAQLVVMPRLITTGGALAVAVDVSWSIGAAALAFVVYLSWPIWSRRKRG